MDNNLKSIKFDIDTILNRRLVEAKKALDSYIDILVLAQQQWESLIKHFGDDYFKPDLENSIIHVESAKQAQEILLSINHTATGHGDIK